MRKIVLGQMLFVLCTCLVTAEPWNIKQMETFFKEQIDDGPFTYLRSPRTGLGVGSIYLLLDKTTHYIARPTDCFSPEDLDQVVEVDLDVTNFEKTSRYNWQLGLRVARSGSGLITEEVNAEFNRKRARFMELKISNLKRMSLTGLQIKKAIRSMDTECRDQLSLKKKPQRWLITEVLYTDSFSMHFTDAGGTNVGIKAGILKVLFPWFKYESEGDYKGTLEFKGTPHIVAFKAVTAKTRTHFSNAEIQEVVNPDLYYAAFE